MRSPRSRPPRWPHSRAFVTARSRSPPAPDLQLAAGFLYLLNGTEPDPAAARALDAYFIVGAEHGFNASTFTARVIIGHPLGHRERHLRRHRRAQGPAPRRRAGGGRHQLNEIGSPEAAAAWIDDALARGERLMGFGHRVYRAYDPRAAALREVAEGMGNTAEWLRLAVAVEDIALQKLAEKSPDRPLKTNVEYYTAAVLQGVGLPPDLFPSTFALARHAGLDRARAGAERGQQAHPSGRPVRRTGRAAPTGGRLTPTTGARSPPTVPPRGQHGRVGRLRRRGPAPAL